ncbi:MAG: hypothetical protein AB8G17_15595 [Gammaproteobacteria bacterium]
MIDERPFGIEELPGTHSGDHDLRAAYETQGCEYAATTSTVTSVCEQMSAIVLDWINASSEAIAQADGLSPSEIRAKQLSDLGVPDLPHAVGFAGRALQNVDDVLRAISGGQIRESLFHFDSFLRKRFIHDVVDSPDVVFDTILSKLNSSNRGHWIRKIRNRFRPEASDPRRHETHTTATTYKETFTLETSPFRDLASSNVDYKRPATQIENLEDEYLEGLCNHLIGVSGSRATHISRLGEVIRNVSDLVGERHPYAWSRARKAELYVQLSRGEKKFVNPINDDWAPYIRGDYANMLDESNSWVREAREAGLPLRSGPSGTAHRLLFASTQLGMNPIDVRFSLAAYLVPIFAHSCHEILTACNGVSGCTYSADDYARAVVSKDLVFRLFSVDIPNDYHK